MSEAKLLDLAPREIDENELRTLSSVPGIEIASPNPADPTAGQIMRIVEVSGTLDFWDAEEEDIYTPDDGQPV